MSSTLLCFARLKKANHHHLLLWLRAPFLIFSCSSSSPPLQNASDQISIRCCWRGFCRAPYEICPSLSLSELPFVTQRRITFVITGTPVLLCLAPWCGWQECVCKRWRACSTERLYRPFFWSPLDTVAVRAFWSHWINTKCCCWCSVFPLQHHSNFPNVFIAYEIIFGRSKAADDVLWEHSMELISSEENLWLCSQALCRSEV